MVDQKTIESLINLIKNHDLQSIEVQYGEHSSVQISNRVPTQALIPSREAPLDVSKHHFDASASTALPDPSLVAPLVGTVYLAPKPGDKPFVSSGDRINKGDVVCIIEAMKVFNKIQSDRDGVVKQIAVKDGDTVACDQILITFDS